MFLSMVVENDVGLYSIPALYLSLVTLELKKVAILDGVTGYVYISTSPNSKAFNKPAYIIEIRFPTRVWGFKYPATCTSQERVPVDVSYIRLGCATFANHLNSLLQPGQKTYEDIFNSLSNTLGYAPKELVFTHPTCIGCNPDDISDTCGS